MSGDPDAADLLAAKGTRAARLDSVHERGGPLGRHGERVGDVAVGDAGTDACPLRSLRWAPGAATPSSNPFSRPSARPTPRPTSPSSKRAYAVAEEYHRGQLRKSGDAYITHPLAVTTILAELGMTPATLAAALLHDTVEDTAYTMPQPAPRLRRGDRRPGRRGHQAGPADLRRGGAGGDGPKMIVAMARDIRVLVIKLADRLHNARTWRYVSKESAQRKAHETLEIHAPLAHRLGMNTIKRELEDLLVRDALPEGLRRDRPARGRARPGAGGVPRGRWLTQVGDDLRAAKLKATVTAARSTTTPCTRR